MAQYDEPRGPASRTRLNRFRHNLFVGSYSQCGVIYIAAAEAGITQQTVDAWRRRGERMIEALQDDEGCPWDEIWKARKKIEGEYQEHEVAIWPESWQIWDRVERETGHPVDPFVRFAWDALTASIEFAKSKIEIIDSAARADWRAWKAADSQLRWHHPDTFVPPTRMSSQPQAEGADMLVERLDEARREAEASLGARPSNGSGNGSSGST